MGVRLPKVEHLLVGIPHDRAEGLSSSIGVNPIGIATQVVKQVVDGIFERLLHLLAQSVHALHRRWSNVLVAHNTKTILGEHQVKLWNHCLVGKEARHAIAQSLQVGVFLYVVIECRAQE